MELPSKEISASGRGCRRAAGRLALRFGTLYGTSMPGAGAVHHIRLGHADHLPGLRIRGRCSSVSGPISVRSNRGCLGPTADIPDYALPRMNLVPT
jgi:hypothetical protein